jgi:carbon storage regulator CsrA
MLIVGREVGESVIIGEDIKVTAMFKGTKPSLVIDAPQNMRVSRIRQSLQNIKQLKQKARKVGETVIIGDVIKVTILQTDTGLLRFAIDAPKEISVFREELYLCKKGSKVTF